jgi:hypothetical protein
VKTVGNQFAAQCVNVRCMHIYDLHASLFCGCAPQQCLCVAPQIMSLFSALLQCLLCMGLQYVYAINEAILCSWIGIHRSSFSAGRKEQKGSCSCQTRLVISACAATMTCHSRVGAQSMSCYCKPEMLQLQAELGSNLELSLRCVVIYPVMICEDY